MNAKQSAMLDIRHMIEEALQPMIGQRVSMSSAEIVRSKVVEILMLAQANGFIEKPPLVDINHVKEIDFYRREVAELNDVIYGNVFMSRDFVDRYQEQIRLHESRISYLLAEVAGTNHTFRVDFKDPDTFQTYLWPRS